MQRILTSQLPQYEGQQIRLQGWLHQVRALGEVNFVLLRDRSGIAQAVVSSETLAPVSNVSVESIIEMCGKVVTSPQAPAGYELHDVSINVLNAVQDPPPIEINKKRVNANLPVFLDHAVIGHRHPEQRAILKISSAVMHAFRTTLRAKDFTEIQSPKIVASATESGAEVYSVEHFGQTGYLAQSPQFYKQIMVGVFERVFEVGPVFRAERHATTRHVNEYVSLDAELGFIESHLDVMQVVTDVIKGIVNYLESQHEEELASLKVEMPKLFVDDESRAFPHIHFADAQKLLTEKYGVTDTKYNPDLTPEHERLLGQWALEEYDTDFVFVTGYPMKKRPFYTHPDTERPEFSNSFDLIFRGTELITGGQRLHVYADYVAAAEKAGFPIDLYKEYFEAFKHGMPAHGGFAIGLERFVMQLLQLDNIRRATLFPRDIHRLVP